jgi:hypothetical protein
MPVVTVPVVVGRDAKLYPLGHRRSAADNQRAADIIHALRHRGLSFRQITAKMGDFGLRVSLGSVWHYWATTKCSQCVPMPVQPPPDPRQKPRSFQWRLPASIRAHWS